MKLLGSETVGHRTHRYWLHTGDDGKDRITVETIEDVEPVLERNKREYSDASKSFGKGEFKKVASIPTVVIDEICRIKNISLSELVQNKTERAHSIWNRLLNAREFRYFRTKPGLVDMKT